MNEERFKEFVALAGLLTDADYQRGYLRGLRRLYHGKVFGTEEEHEQWLALSDTREKIGQGYRDGFHGKAPHVEIYGEEQ